MKRIILTLLLFASSVAVEAQIYRWQDENNKTIISDRPPPNSVRKAKKIEAESPPASDAGKSMADREMDFRKRQKESKESAEKAEKETRLAAEKQENCDQARRALRLFESGERVLIHDSKGERMFMDDAQREQEIVRNRQYLQQNCN
ncbi:MAG: DUF4124 domain-containing protein [Candidatus Accumulibacter sp.]|nr:DUF4124 domain-containing protein [Accumulibacter sp.]